MFIVGPRKQLKQIFQIEHNIVKNPNWLEANQLAIYKRGRGFELGATEKQIQVVVRVGLEPGTAGLRVQHATTRPRCRVVSLQYKASTVLLLYGKTDTKKMKTAMHDNDFAQKSKWEFQSINFF